MTGLATRLPMSSMSRFLQCRRTFGDRKSAIGDIVSIQHLEPVGYWHQAHSYVRGNWRKESESSSMLLAKSCHDLDWIRYIMGARCVAVSSFGSLKHFRKEEKPSGAGERCLDCSYEPRCPYSALKIYLGRIEKGQVEWPVNVITEDVSREGVQAALRDGPYGRCVYECDNDVVDNQVVNLLFEGGRTAAFTMTGFSEYQDRKTRIFGLISNDPFEGVRSLDGGLMLTDRPGIGVEKRI